MRNPERSMQWRIRVATIGVSVVAAGSAVGTTGVGLLAKELYLPGSKPAQAVNRAINLEKAGALIAGVGVVVASRARGKDGKLPI